MTKVIFVCLGNICRSPAAEGIFQHMVNEQGLKDQFQIDSAGTSGYHQGEPADGRMQDHAKQRGYELTSLSRQFLADDFDIFDLIITMDDSNFENVLALAAGKHHHDKVKTMTSYCKIHSIDEVPDPYYRGADGFEHVLDILEDGCQELLKSLNK